MAVARVLQENVVRGNQAGRIVETTEGKKVFLVGNTRGETGGPSGGGDQPQATKLGGNLSDAYARAVSGGRFEGIEAEQGREARARAQMAWESENAGRAVMDAQERARAEQERLLAEQRAQEDAALGAFRSRVEGFEKPSAIFSRLEQERGVPQIRERTKGLRQQVGEAEALLEKLPGDVTGRVAGTMTTQGQRNRILAKEQIPITENLQALSRLLGTESANLGEAMQAVGDITSSELTAQQQSLEPDRLRISMLSDRAARELSAFTQDRERELNILMDKLDRTRQLSDQEFQRAAQLSSQEQAYTQALNQLEAQSRLGREDLKMQQQFESGESEKSRTFQRELANLQARSSGGGSAQLPADVRTFQYLAGLSGDQQDLFLRMLGEDVPVRSFLGTQGLQFHTAPPRGPIQIDDSATLRLR